MKPGNPKHKAHTESAEAALYSVLNQVHEYISALVVDGYCCGNLVALVINHSLWDLV